VPEADQPPPGTVARGAGAPDAVWFDVDDTLVDFAGAARLALLDVVREHLQELPSGPDEGPSGLVGAADRAWEQVSETEYRRFTAGEVDFEQMRVNRMAAFLRTIGRPGADRLSHELLEDRRNSAIFGHFRLFGDVPACLDRLHRAGVTVRVLSNSDGAYQRAKLAAVGLGDLGDSGFYSGELGVAKPDPRIFRAAAEQLGLPTGRISYVGDRWDVDVLGAAAAGMRPVWLNRTAQPRRPDSRDAAVPVLEIGSLDELDIEP
jgi:putative hydrolase of the HAD superfamily